MAISQEITENVKQIRTAAYGKDVREAIARGLEICYGYTSGEAADRAAERANRAAASVEESIDSAAQATEEVQTALNNLNSIVEVSNSQPTSAQNKIWIQPQSEAEYKVATFAAYEALWERMNEINGTYEQGHGGIVNVTEDSSYVDPSDLLKKRYSITYSDGTTGEFFLRDGERGQTGAVDTPNITTVYYKKETPAEYTGRRPDTYATVIPQDLSPGDYLWTITQVEYLSGAKVYFYALTRMGQNGINGSGAVHSVAIGPDGEALAGDIKLPIDTAPTNGSGNLLTSGAVYSALQSYAPLSSPVFTGSPTAPTVENNTDSSTKLATTAFVQNVVGSSGKGMRKISVTIPAEAEGMGVAASDITENTYCLFPDFDSSGLTNLTWETANRGVTFSTTPAPSSDVTLTVILCNPAVW